jgi:ATP-dependent helicase/nuclease subunit A
MTSKLTPKRPTNLRRQTLANVIPFPPLAIDIPLPGPPDAEARLRALDIRSSFIVEAPAGSGKTALLIQRFLKLLADDSVSEPEQVLAVTFTNKATAELRDRVLEHLEAAQVEAEGGNSSSVTASDFDRQTRGFALAVLERDRRFGWSLLEQPRRLNIRTIDSVCADIAHTLPVLSGSGGRLMPATDAKPLHREAARRTLLLLGSGEPGFDQALRDLLLHRDGNLADCETLIANMLSLRDQWGDLVPLTQPQLDDSYLDSTLLPRLERALDHAICASLTRLARVFPTDILDDLTALAAELGELNGYRGSASPVALCAGLRKSPETVSAHLDHWRALIRLLVNTSSDSWRKGFNANHVGIEWEHYHKNRLKALVERINHRDDLLEALCEVRSLPAARYPHDQWGVAKSLFRILSRALVELQFVFAAHNQCDFTELSLLARHALEADGGPEDLATALGARLQHLLVDEMQDTSTSQYALIQLLTASWDGHSQTVFLVGDPRQSIYLFRQARVERFLHAMHAQRLGDLPLTRLRLTANFRSQRNLVEQFNNDFAAIFPDNPATQADPLGLPYEPAEATLAASPSASGSIWHAHILPGSTAEQTPAQIKQFQARRNAAEILSVARSWIAKALPPGRKQPWKMAVLVSARSHLKEIVAALRKQVDPVPFRAVEIEALNERQEILDLTALTRALLHPADRVATLAVLRAPWCGLPLADLHTLTGADDPGLKRHSIQRLMAERGHLVPDESCERMTRVWTVLDGATINRSRFTTAQLVERAWRSLGGDAWLSPSQIANTRRFFQLLDELESNGVRTDLTALQDRLGGLYAEPEAIPAGAPFLELLTIHKAKGLEWDVVFVPALEGTPSANRSRLLTWAEIDSAGPGDTAAHIMLAPIAARGEGIDTLTSWLNSIHRSREAAERKRLFYVACTRAREELHLFASPATTANGEIALGKDTLLKAAWPAAEPHFKGDAITPAFAYATAMSVMEPAVMPPSAAEQPALSFAAAADPAHAIVQRLPSAFDPGARFIEARTRKLQYGEPDAGLAIDQTQFSRPEGSFAARSFGNVVHACLDTLASRILGGSSAATLLAELPTWHPRIAALLRADGLPPATVGDLTRAAGSALENTLRDRDGLWLLDAHARSANEFSLSAFAESSDDADPASARPASVRIDRVFHAGAEPHAPGEDFLWIIDYKTTAHGATGLDDFLVAQRATYGPQLEAYARILAPSRSKPLSEVRVALYFPTIPRLTYWNPAEQPTST